MLTAYQHISSESKIYQQFTIHQWHWLYINVNLTLPFKFSPNRSFMIWDMHFNSQENALFNVRIAWLRDQCLDITFKTSTLRTQFHNSSLQNSFCFIESYSFIASFLNEIPSKTRSKLHFCSYNFTRLRFCSVRIKLRYSWAIAGWEFAESVGVHSYSLVLVTSQKSFLSCRNAKYLSKKQRNWSVNLEIPVTCLTEWRCPNVVNIHFTYFTVIYVSFDDYFSTGKQSTVFSVCLFHFRLYELRWDQGVEFCPNVSLQGGNFFWEFVSVL